MGIRRSILRLNSDLTVPLGAFVPLRAESVSKTFSFLAHFVEPDVPISGIRLSDWLAAIPNFWNSNAVSDFVALTHADTNHPVRLVLLYVIPVIVCWLIVRQPLRVLEFASVYVGIVLFANIWDYPGFARHHGVMFLAFIASVWAARLWRAPDKWSSWAFAVILTINAFAGVLTLASELRPFSQGKNAAAWIKQNNLVNAFLIGSRDAQVSSVVAFLGRPIYYLECECHGTFIVWNNKRQSPLSPGEFERRLARAIGFTENREVILVRNRPVALEGLKAGTPSLSVTLLESFTGALTDENYWIYRVSRTSSP